MFHDCCWLKVHVMGSTWHRITILLCSVFSWDIYGRKRSDFPILHIHLQNKQNFWSKEGNLVPFSLYVDYMFHFDEYNQWTEFSLEFRLLVKSLFSYFIAWISPLSPHWWIFSNETMIVDNVWSAHSSLWINLISIHVTNRNHFWKA